MSFGRSSRDLVSRLALAKLSEDLVASPERRAAFVTSPEAYLSEEYGAKLADDDQQFVERLKDLVADGFCCKGCGCLAPDLGERVVNPALR